MAQAALKIPDGAEAFDIQLLQAIKAGQDENDVEISLVLNALNKGLAGLVDKNGRILTRLQGDVLKQLNRQFVCNDNTIDAASTATLAWTQSELDGVNLLLTQLAAQAGMTSPGDPLEAALTNQLVQVPEMAYSATLLLAIRDAMPCLCRIAAACDRIADALESSGFPSAESGLPSPAESAGGTAPPETAVPKVNSQPAVTWEAV